MSHGYAGDGSTFVPVIQVPGLAVIQRKAEPELGAMEKVMAFSVFGSWPIMAISAVLTILAALLIWFLVSKYVSFYDWEDSCWNDDNGELYGAHMHDVLVSNAIDGGDDSWPLFWYFF